MNLIKLISIYCNKTKMQQNQVQHLKWADDKGKATSRWISSSRFIDSILKFVKDKYVYIKHTWFMRLKFKYYINIYTYFSLKMWHQVLTGVQPTVTKSSENPANVKEFICKKSTTTTKTINWKLHMSALYKMQMWLESFFIHFLFLFLSYFILVLIARTQ